MEKTTHIYLKRLFIKHFEIYSSGTIGEGRTEKWPLCSIPVMKNGETDH